MTLLDAATRSFYELYKRDKEQRKSLGIQMVETHDLRDAPMEVPDMVRIKINHQGTVSKFKISKKVSFAALMRQYRKAAKVHEDTQVEFEFDGEPVDLKTTVGDLDMDDGDQLDAHYLDL